MNEYVGRLQHKGKEYPIAFNLNVMELIQKEYGTVDKWGELTDGASGEPDAKAIIYGFTHMINEGLEIEADENGTEYKPLTYKQVGRLITEYGLTKATNDMNKIVIESTKSEEKNA